MSDILNKALMNTTDQSLLIPQDLNPLIHGLLKEQFPLWNLVGREKAQGPVHEYRIRSAYPGAWFQGELSDSNFTSATYTSREVRLKIVRSWGGVSSFMQVMSQNFVNALSESIETAVLGFANTVEWSLLYGNYTADSYQPLGINTQMLADATAKTAYTSGGNIYDLNTALTLTHLDQMLDRTARYRQSAQDSRVFIASRDMISRISGLQTRVTRLSPPVEFEGGFLMETYRGVPLLPSDLLVPQSTTTSPTLTPSATAGGTLPDATYHYSIASVTITGEQTPSADASQATATTNNSVTLTFTADANAKLYYIYRGTSSSYDTHALLDVVNALTYDGAGNITGARTTYIDNGSKTPNTAFRPLNTGEQVYLVNTSANERGVKIMGAVSPLGDPIEDYVTYTPLATTGPAFKFMVEGFLGYKIPYPTLNGVLRRSKLS